MSRDTAKRNIPFSPPDISELEINEVVDALRSGWITTGPRTKELEKRLAEYCHTEKCVCLSSATAAEELNLRVLGIGEGDEVIVPAYTYTASASAAIHVGAKVIFVDSQPHSVEMDYDQMEAAITEKTKAIIAVDLGGIICDYDRIYQAVENKRHLFTPTGNREIGQRIQKARSELSGTVKRQERSRISPVFPSTRSRTSQPPRAALRLGEPSTALITKRFTSSFSYTAFTVRARTRSPKP